MNARVSLICGLLSLGCGDDPKTREEPNGAAGEGGASNGDGPGSAGRGGNPEGGVEGDGVAEGTRVFSGVASMLFDGPACTREAGAASDRWCGFVARSDTGERNLFVVNVSVVLTGDAVSCDGASEHCLLLTESLGGDSFDPTQHGTLFQGDTLAYYDAAFAPYAWRPGTESGRLLVEVSASLDAVFCTPATRGTVVGCLGLPVEQVEPDLARADLLVGLADGSEEPLLTAVDAVIASNAADAIPRFGYGYPDVPGDYVAWTTRESASGPETLKLLSAADLGSKTTVAADVHDFSVSRDGTRWFWLHAIDAAGSGTLQTAPFPSGENPSDVVADAVQHAESPAGSVVVRTRGAELIAIADSAAAPSERITLDTGVLELLEVTNAEYVAYVKHFAGASSIDLYVAQIDGGGVCELDSSVSVPLRSVFFSPDGDSVVWARSNESGGFDGYYTDLSRCFSEPLAPDVVALAWLGDDAIFSMVDFDSVLGVGSVRVRGVARDNRLEPEASWLVAHDVDTYAITDPDRRTLVYTVNGGGDADGVYVTRVP
jgi:hypothetical protein